MVSHRRPLRARRSRSSPRVLEQHMARCVERSNAFGDGKSKPTLPKIRADARFSEDCGVGDRHVKSTLYSQEIFRI